MNENVEKMLKIMADTKLENLLTSANDDFRKNGILVPFIPETDENYKTELRIATYGLIRDWELKAIKVYDGVFKLVPSVDEVSIKFLGVEVGETCWYLIKDEVRDAIAAVSVSPHPILGSVYYKAYEHDVSEIPEHLLGNADPNFEHKYDLGIAVNRLVKAIITYDSDTFSAVNIEVDARQAEEMAAYLIYKLLFDEGGCPSNKIDGYVLENAFEVTQNIIEED